MFALALPLRADDELKGKLVIVGGGLMPSGLHRRMLELAGGPKARVLVIGQASQSAESGDSSARSFASAGATTVSTLKTTNPAEALAAVQSADLIWFGGGKQSLLMTELQRLKLVAPIRERYQRGAVIGGTSAGAAVMSKVMITGKPKRVGEVPPLSEGLGLWPETIVDQHFIVRNREPRLLAAVKANPKLLGVGIDESTFVIVSGDRVEVDGKSTVVLLDARTGGEPKRRELKAGNTFSLSHASP